jgi:hypothetical protein
VAKFGLEIIAATTKTSDYKIYYAAAVTKVHKNASYKVRAIAGNARRKTVAA